MGDISYQALMNSMPQPQEQSLWQGLSQPAQAPQMQGAVMSDANPDPVLAGQQYAQSSPLQMRPIGGGQVQVINIRTGQVVYTGSAAGAAHAQASNAGMVRRID